MPTIRKLAELFRAIATHDAARAGDVAAEICKGEEHKGHRSAARLLRGALAAGAATHPSLPPSHGTNGISTSTILSSALVRLDSSQKLRNVVLTNSARDDLDNVVLEWRKRDRLRARGIERRSRLLFYGPPGCGKSLTARALGCETGLPVYLVRFDAVIGAYLGQTAIHLRQLFHFAETTACVLLLDELDALGKRRGNPLDVGELDRIVISLMQELEHSRPMGFIIATSNLPRHLDDALWRRFDLSMSFGRPNRNALSLFVHRVAKQRRLRLSAGVLRKAARLKSFAEAATLVEAEARRQVLHNR